MSGNGVTGSTGDGSFATSASLNYPVGVDIDTAGNVYIGARFNNKVRMLSSQVITTFAGMYVFILCVCVYVYMYVCMYVCMYVYINVYIYA